MFVQALEIDSLIGNWTIERPDWSVVEREIRALDGGDKDSLALDSGKSYMGISGGNNNQYVVGGYLEGHDSFIAASGSDSKARVQVPVCGDFNEYVSINVVDLESVIAMAKVFYHHGKLSPEFRWEKERRIPANE